VGQSHLLETQSAVGALSTELVQPLVNEYYLRLSDGPGSASASAPGFIPERVQAWIRDIDAYVAWHHLGARIYIDAFERHSVLDDVGFLVWGLVCVWAIWRLRQPPLSNPPEGLKFRLGAAEAITAWQKHPRLVGRHYWTYLLAQVGVCIAHFLNDAFLQQSMQAFAAAGYAGLALRVREYFQQLQAFEAKRHTDLGKLSQLQDLEERRHTVEKVISAFGKRGSTTAGEPTEPEAPAVQLAATTRREASREGGRLGSSVPPETTNRPPTPRGRLEWQNLSAKVKQRIARNQFVYEYESYQPGYPQVFAVWIFSLLLVCFTHKYVPESSKQGYVMYALYAPSCLAAYACLWGFLLRCKASEGKELRFTWILGVVGGTFGIANLCWPCLFPPQFFHILSRIGDSCLYVPLVLRAVRQMDEEMWTVVPWAKQEHGPSIQPLFFGRWRWLWQGSFLAIMVACQAWEMWTPFMAETLQAAGWTTTLQLCHNQADIDAHTSACASGTAVLKAIDGHTRVVFGLNQMLDAAAAPDLVPTHVTVPVWEGKLSIHKRPTRLLPGSGFGITIPSFDVTDDHQLQVNTTQGGVAMIDIKATYIPLHFLRRYSLIDVDAPWEDPAQGTAVIEAVGERSLKALVPIRQDDHRNDRSG
jgi:hypothetical protein